MTTQEQIIAIAELDGWHNIQPNPLYPNRYAGFTKGDTHALCGIPDYLTSRDAIIPVIEKQPKDIQYKILLAHFNKCPIPVTQNRKDHWLSLLFITPPQLAEALLRATGKWKG